MDNLVDWAYHLVYTINMRKKRTDVMIRVEPETRYKLKIKALNNKTTLKQYLKRLANKK